MIFRLVQASGSPDSQTPSLPSARQGSVADGRESCITYGRVAAIVGVALVWFAIWTLTCNVLVLGGFHYAPVPWMLLVTTAFTGVVGWLFFQPVATVYAKDMGTVVDDRTVGFPVALLLAAGTAVITAIVTHRIASPFPYIGGTALAALLIWQVHNHELPTRVSSSALAIGWRPAALFVLLAAIYYFSHRADGDDASIINLAIGRSALQAASTSLTRCWATVQTQSGFRSTNFSLSNFWPPPSLVLPDSPQSPYFIWSCLFRRSHC